jgi:hypothetical protein
LTDGDLTQTEKKNILFLLTGLLKFIRLGKMLTGFLEATGYT